MRGLVPLLLVMLVVAFLAKLDLFFYLFYALSGIYILGRLWARRSLRAIDLRRHHDKRVFLKQSIPVEIEVRNRGWLPVLWLRLGDGAPGELMAGEAFRRVISLRPREHQRLSYTLLGRRRGYYPFGPLITLGGDLLGSKTYETHYAEGDYVIVYPQIVALRALGFPTQSPAGTLPSRQRLFEDPSRVRGVREYQPGDSLRRIDWKASARVGVLQVRRLEPSMALEVAVFLNLAIDDYPIRWRTAATEMGIVVAASVATHLIEKRQAVGLATNGRDPLAGEAATTPAFPLRKGREHLMHMLDLLARVEATAKDEPLPFLDLVSRGSLGLPWGSTMVLITAQEQEGLFDVLLTLRRRGLSVLLVLTWPGPEYPATVQRAGQLGVQVVPIRSEQDMDVWR